MDAQNGTYASASLKSTDLLSNELQAVFLTVETIYTTETLKMH
jgi:hypothetical protein